MLDDLLKESRHFAAEYGDQLSNHLPMALIALERLGASDSHLKLFFDSYSRRLSPQVSRPVSIDLGNWKSYLGQHTYNTEYRNYFLREIAQVGKEQVLRKYLQVLAPGLSGGAFHPLIRTAYALLINDEWEIAESLAAWCIAYQELGEIINHRSSETAINTLQLARAGKLIALNLEAPNIFLKMKKVSESKSFHEALASFSAGSNSLREISQAALRIYRCSDDNFTALHCVTAAHAARIVLPYFDDKAEFLAYLWQAIAAAYVTIGSISLDSPADNPTPSLSWNEVFSLARTSLNDHVIKFCFTAYQEHEFYGEPAYLQLAGAKAKGR